MCETDKKPSMNMKIKIQNLLLAVTLFAGTIHAGAQGTAFTYQGQLLSNNIPVTGSVYLKFALYSGSCSNGINIPITTTNEPITLPCDIQYEPVPVDNGLFTVNLDFGPTPYQYGQPLWLAIFQSTNGLPSTYTLVTNLVAVTPTPYAIVAETAESAGTAENLSAGTYGNAVTFNNSGNSFSGNGSGLTGVNAAALATGAAMGAGSANSVGSASDAFIGGGYNNLINNANYSFIGGGWQNFILYSSSPYTAIGGGQNNEIQANAGWSVIAGGLSNTVSGAEAVIGGGDRNTASGQEATVAGGTSNLASGVSATVGGGQFNQAESYYDTVGGGTANTANGGGDTVGGGNGNQALSVNSSVAGGQTNTANAGWAGLGGGLFNQVNATYGAIGGGLGNNLQSGATAAFIGGGQDNTISNSADHADVAGGWNNTIGIGAYDSFIGGGVNNTNNGTWSTISGGDHNKILASVDHATIGGGGYNTNGGGSATVAGGYLNAATAPDATVGGGNLNTAGGNYATVPGGYNNHANGAYSFAGGYGITAGNSGAFVWNGDTSISGTTIVVGSVFWVQEPGGFTLNGETGNGTIECDNLSIKSTGQVLINTTATLPSEPLVVGPGNAYCDGSTWVSVSDRNAKQDIASINPLEVLEKVSALPITEWEYKQTQAGAKHIGPMAQDFHAAFGLDGSDDTHISTVDEGGVALAAIQGLNQKLEETQQTVAAKDDEIKNLKEQNDLLAQRLNALEQMVQNLGQKKSPPLAAQ